MGIKGLTRWIQSNNSILSTHESYPNPNEVDPVAIVIDGLAFLHFSAHFDSIRGGNYTAYRQVVIDHVLYWRSVGLEPHFVFDGTFGESKRDTIINRTEQSIETMVEYMKSTNPSLSLLKKASKLPPMSRSACITALRSLSVSIYFCEEEGDAPVCELAQRLNGYMVSNDSDYFIFNTTCLGYIPLQTLSYGPANRSLHSALSTPDNSPSVSMTVYRSQSLADLLGIPITFLPIFASLLGNDVVDYGKEFSLAGREPVHNGQFDKSEFNRINEALHSFRNLPSSTASEVHAVITAIVPALFHATPNYKYQEIIEKLSYSCQSYNVVPFDSITSSFPLHPRSTDTLQQSQCRQLYLEAFKSGQIGRLPIQVIKNQFLVSPLLVELPDLASISVVLGRPIRLWIYSLLNGAVGIEADLVTECVRRQSSLNLVQVPIPDLADLFTLLPFQFPSSPIPLLSSNNRLNILLAIFNSSDLPSSPLNSNLTPFLPLILALRHIQLLDKSPWNTTQLLSAITTSVLLSTSTPESLTDLINQKTSNHSLIPIKSNLHKSSQLVSTLFHIELLIETLLLKQQVVECHTLFEGNLFHFYLESQIGNWEKVIKKLGKRNEELILGIYKLVDREV